MSESFDDESFGVIKPCEFNLCIFICNSGVLRPHLRSSAKDVWGDFGNDLKFFGSLSVLLLLFCIDDNQSTGEDTSFTSTGVKL